MASKLRPPAEAAKFRARLGIGKTDDDDSGPAKAAVTIYFERDSIKVEGEYAALVRACAERFNAKPAGMLIVSGHATSADEPEHEVKLSHRRTRSVAKLLEDLGVPSHQIVCVSRGANEPLVDASDTASRWINRRVEIREGDLVPRPPAWARQRRKKSKPPVNGKAAATSGASAAAKAVAEPGAGKPAIGKKPAAIAPAATKPVAKKPAVATAAPKQAAKQPAAQKAAAKTVATKAAAKKSAAKPAAKTAAAKKPVAKKAVAKKPAVKKPVATKAAAKKTAAKKPVAKKAAPKKAAAKKPVAKKTTARTAAAAKASRKG